MNIDMKSTNCPICKDGLLYYSWDKSGDCFFLKCASIGCDYIGESFKDRRKQRRENDNSHSCTKS